MAKPKPGQGGLIFSSLKNKLSLGEAKPDYQSASTSKNTLTSQSKPSWEAIFQGFITCLKTKEQGNHIGHVVRSVY